MRSFGGCSKNKEKVDIPTNSDNLANLKVPIDATASEFFGRKPTISEIQKLLSPAGFLNEVQFKDYDGITQMGEFEQLQPEKVLSTTTNTTDTDTDTDTTTTTEELTEE